MKKTLNRLVLAIAILITAGCSMDYPVIGIEVLRDGAMESKLRVRYFESKSTAIKFYEENKIEKYSLHINPDEDEKKLFDGIQWEEEGGAKTVGFLADEGGKSADTKAIAFMNDELGLKTECVGSASGCK